MFIFLKLSGGFMPEKIERKPVLPILEPAKKPSYPDITKFKFTCRNDRFHTNEEYQKIEKERKRQVALERKRGAKEILPLTHYIPHITDPVKIICVNFHIFRDSNGQGHYQTTEIDQLKQIIRWVNDRYEFGDTPSDKPIQASMTIKDSRIRWRLNRIEFYNDDSLHVSQSVSALQAAAVAQNASTLDQLNVYFTGGEQVSEAAAAWANLPSPNPGWDSWVMMPYSYTPEAPDEGGYCRSNTLAHEFGHNLGLMHTYNGGGAPADCNQEGPEFLYDIFGLDPGCTCPHLCNWEIDASRFEPHLPNAVVTNNLMGGNKSNHWISALQAARMQYALKEMSVKRYIATGCNDCLGCLAFTVRGVNHVSQGGNTKLIFQNVDLNESWGWNGQDLVAPVAGIYHFDISFMKDAFYYNGTTDDVFVHLIKNGAGAPLATAWSGEGPKRAAGGVSINTRLQVGDIISTMANSDGGRNRHIAMYTFSGQLICACCQKECYGGERPSGSIGFL
jgi:hypothetical protein